MKEEWWGITGYATPNSPPNDEIKKQITKPIAELKAFAKKIIRGEITTPKGGRFENLLIIGIGGSALGPQFIYEALGANSPLKTFFFDNTDPRWHG